MEWFYFWSESLVEAIKSWWVDTKQRHELEGGGKMEVNIGYDKGILK